MGSRLIGLPVWSSIKSDNFFVFRRLQAQCSWPPRRHGLVHRSRPQYRVTAAGPAQPSPSPAPAACSARSAASAASAARPAGQGLDSCDIAGHTQPRPRPRSAPVPVYSLLQELLRVHTEGVALSVEPASQEVQSRGQPKGVPGQKSCECKQCHKKFSQVRSLKTQLRVHTEVNVNRVTISSVRI